MRVEAENAEGDRQHSAEHHGATAILGEQGYISSQPPELVHLCRAARKETGGFFFVPAELVTALSVRPGSIQLVADVAIGVVLTQHR